MTSAIDKDLAGGLPEAGSNIGGFMKGVAPGAGSLMLTSSMANLVPKMTHHKIGKHPHKVHKYKIQLHTHKLH